MTALRYTVCGLGLPGPLHGIFDQRIACPSTMAGAFMRGVIMTFNPSKVIHFFANRIRSSLIWFSEAHTTFPELRASQTNPDIGGSSALFGVLVSGHMDSNRPF
ncbi:hypothetical protein [Ferrovum sp.]|uniref:hypothetical protein n=1 Tax=Ferrovum sp. TaxID=2609467 RepID=UPI0026187D27|nr:hypothetical protein [Ferrovum sp.]